MILISIAVGPLMANCYILGCERTKAAAVIDPGDEEQDILAALEANRLELKYILLTHGHIDHIGAAKEIQDATGVEIFIHPDDLFLLDAAGLQAAMLELRTPAAFKATLFQDPHDPLAMGDYQIQIIATPGHSPGSVCFKIDDSLFSGDTLFYEAIGRTDLFGGSMQQIYTSIENKLLTLASDTKVFPGHGPATCIEHEIKFNPFFSQRVQRRS